MTTVAHTASLLRQALARVVNVDAPFLDKSQRLRLAEDALTAAAGFLDEIVAAHPEECAGHWPALLVDQSGNGHHMQIAADGPLYINDVQPDEIDVDPDLWQEAIEGRAELEVVSAGLDGTVVFDQVDLDNRSALEIAGDPFPPAIAAFGERE